jgi:hypothetical protein
MPKGKTNTDSRISDLRKMTGTDFALQATRDLVVLPPEERSKAIRVLTALNETINRETEEAATK